MFLIELSQLRAVYIGVFGSLLTKKPEYVLCGDRRCTVDEACLMGDFQFDKDDYEYMDNWTQQYDLLCEDNLKIGLVGTFLVLGIISTLVLSSWVSD